MGSYGLKTMTLNRSTMTAGSFMVTAVSTATFDKKNVYNIMQHKKKGKREEEEKKNTYLGVFVLPEIVNNL